MAFLSVRQNYSSLTYTVNNQGLIAALSWLSHQEVATLSMLVFEVRSAALLFGCHQSHCCGCSPAFYDVRPLLACAC